MTFPIKLTEYLHGDKFHETDGPEELREEGVPEDVIDKIRYLTYELKLELELYENGDIYITHVADMKLAIPIKNT